MEKLIEIQSLIMKYEEITNVENSYKSQFHYKDDETLIIETSRRDWRVLYELMFMHRHGLVVYVKDNKTLEIQCW